MFKTHSNGWGKLYPAGRASTSSTAIGREGVSAVLVSSPTVVLVSVVVSDGSASTIAAPLPPWGEGDRRRSRPAWEVGDEIARTG